MNTELQELFSRRDRYTSQAKAAAMLGDTERANKFKEQAVKANDAIKVIEEVEGLNTEKSFTGRPALPGSGEGTMTNGDDSASKSAKAAYVVRFGNPDAAVEQILSEVNGKDHEFQYARQRRAFKAFLHFGDADMDRSEKALLKQIILTPKIIRRAIAEGADDVAAIKSTMVESVSSLGGYIVPVDFQDRVIERLQGMTVMRGRAQTDTTSSDKVEIPVATGGDDQYTSAVRVTWVNEKPTSTQSETNLTFGSEAIPIHTVMAKTWVSRNLVEDAAFDVESYLVRKFAEAQAIDEDNKFLVGTGAGCPQGILPGATNALSLTEKVSGSGSALTIDGLISLYYGIASQYRQNAVWVAERSTYEAIMKLKTAGNDYFWQPFQYVGGANGQPMTLMGKPVLEQEAMPSVAANAYPIVFGDMAAYQIFDRVGMSVERYLDSATANINTIQFLMRRRLGGQVTEPWRLAVQKVST